MSEIGCSTQSCSLHGVLQRQNINMQSFDYLVALAGNPNTGKSTVFNALTGLRQHTGNWPGKTVIRAEGMFEYNNNRYKLIDLPGTYSLLSMSQEEEVANDFLLLSRPDVTVVVVDAARLERNLNFVLQILEITDKVVVCLNLIDEASRKGIIIDENQLQADLGVPVVPTSAIYKKGLGKLIESVVSVAEETITTTPYRINNIDNIEGALDELIPQIETLFPDIINPRWVALRLLEGDDAVIDKLQTSITDEEIHNGTITRHLQEQVAAS